MAPVPDHLWQPIRDHVGRGLTADEWRQTSQRLQPGAVIEGKVLACLPVGFWMSLGERLAGQVETVSIIDEERPPEDSDWPRPGSVVRAKVIDVSHDRRRIRLTIRPSDLTT